MENQKTSNQFCFVIQLLDSSGDPHVDCFGNSVSPNFIETRVRDYFSLSGAKFWMARHDSDTNEDGTNKRLHLHCVVHLGVSRRSYLQIIKELSSWTGICADAVSAESVNNLEGCLRYLLHLDNPEKFQYEKRIVTSNALETFDNALAAVEVYSATNLIALCESCKFDKIAVLRTIGIERYQKYRSVISDICQCGVQLSMK